MSRTGPTLPVSPASFEYRLEHTPVGVVVLDPGRRIRAMNQTARRLLRAESAAAGTPLLDLHPPAARVKVRWLLDAAENAVDGSAAMVITTLFGSLVAKVTLLGDDGYCMMVHALGETAMTAPEHSEQGRLLKLPLLRNGGTELIDIDEVACLSAQGHYAEALTGQGRFLCPLSLAALGQRVDGTVFVRVHRRHLVNLRRVRQAQRQDGRWLLMLEDGQTRIPVGRDKVDLLRRLLAV